MTVCHFPPGTSKRNSIEHRLFSRIGINWRGRPLTSHDRRGPLSLSDRLLVTVIHHRWTAQIRTLAFLLGAPRGANGRALR